ncbi:hypothetical protein SAMN04488121_109311 [Chitinophaga filiformis]|uniref:Uncharacterized protein n=1 Tax=Chitinophaga filiformis TaxID=104663 RepID=A0A1G8ALD5_CHIFI|nr:hypothetical protein SAMN04488121_109311 [Chitinophaga filiformis]
MLNLKALNILLTFQFVKENDFHILPDLDPFICIQIHFLSGLYIKS